MIEKHFLQNDNKLHRIQMYWQKNGDELVMAFVCERAGKPHPARGKTNEIDGEVWSRWRCSTRAAPHARVCDVLL